MRFWVVLLISFSFFSAVVADGIFSWKDAKGIVHYGDSPPDSVESKTVDLPELTVIKDYGKLYKPVLTLTEQGLVKDQRKQLYSELSIIAPKNKQAIRANDGDITVMLSFKPKLLPNHQLSVFLDDKKMAEGALQMVNLTNLDRGDHTVYAVIKNDKGKEVISSKSIVFTVIRR